MSFTRLSFLKEVTATYTSTTVIIILGNINFDENGR
jgi:hypothetical protein